MVLSTLLRVLITLFRALVTTTTNNNTTTTNITTTTAKAIVAQTKEKITFFYSDTSTRLHCCLPLQQICWNWFVSCKCIDGSSTISEAFCVLRKSVGRF